MALPWQMPLNDSSLGRTGLEANQWMK